jgi:RHS repeat-associated protein
LSFTGQDTISGLHDFLFRKFNPIADRWLSPDPAGVAAVDQTTPQTWNRYAYVMNATLTFVDPLGLCDKGKENDRGTCTGPGGGGFDETYQDGTDYVTITVYGGPSLSDISDSDIANGAGGNTGRASANGGGGKGRGARPANTATISAGTLDQLNAYCSARGRARFIADWVPGGGTIARTLWGSNNGAQLGFYQLSTADLNNITGENSGGQTVALHAASEGLKTAAGSTAFLSWFRGATGVPKTFASAWLGRLSLALIVADASSGFYKEVKEILNCQAGN